MLTRAGALSLEPLLQYILLSYVGVGGLSKYFPKLTLNYDPPDLNLPRI
jgi:hypothetical protein